MQRVLWKRRKELVTDVTSVADNLYFVQHIGTKENFIDNSDEKILLYMNFEQLPKQRLRMVCKQ